MNSQFDWYQVSKLDEQQPDIQEFAQILKTPSIQTEKIPLYLRKKVLLMFQNVSHNLKSLCEQEENKNQQLQFQKKVVRQQLESMESNLESSLHNIQSLKIQLKQKKKQISKLQEKITKKKNSTPKEVFFCPFCQREDFPSKDVFSFHMFKEHRDAYSNESKSFNNPSGYEDLKQIILSLKDKQIELMSMMLEQKKHMDTQELQKNYQLQLMKMTNTKPNILEQGLNAASEYERSNDDELKGQSQYLFYKEKNEEEERQYQERLVRRRDQQATAFKRAYLDQRQRYQKEVYYDIFPGLSQHKKINFDTENKYMDFSQPVQNQNRKTPMENRSYPSRQLQWDRSLRTPSEYYKNQVEVKTYQMKKKSLEKDESPRRVLNTVYENKKQLEEGYIFNSGPLMDDVGGDSEYQDYFEREDNSEVEDEQIKMENVRSQKQNISEYESIKMASSDHKTHQNILLQYSKEKSSLVFEGQGESSFSKRDFQLSKDDETINLSDLKLSKLDKKKEEVKNEKDFRKQKVSENILNEFFMEEQSSSQWKKEQSSSQWKKEQSSSNWRREESKASRRGAQKRGSVLDEFIREQR